MPQQADTGNDYRPDYKHFQGIDACFSENPFQFFSVSRLPGRPIKSPELLQGAESQEAFYRYQMDNHIRYPAQPQQMQPGKFMEEAESFQHIEAQWICKIHEKGEYKDTEPERIAKSVRFFQVWNFRHHFLIYRIV
jgi:hypothetical protein